MAAAPGIPLLMSGRMAAISGLTERRNGQFSATPNLSDI